MASPHLNYVTDRAFRDDILALAAQLAADEAWRPDFIIGIGRGGLVPGTYLSHATGVPMLSIDHSAQLPEFAAELLTKLAARTRSGERLLFIDDINDSGRTIEHLRTALAAAGGVAAGIRFAVLIDNVGSRAQVDYRARMIDRAVTKDWFVFPWEAVAPAARLAEEALSEPDRLG